MNDTRKPAQRTAATARTSQGFTDEAEEEAAVLAKIAEMTDSDRTMAERLHAIVKAGAPGLAPKLWYGIA
ncbi:hypothetical protein ACFWP3_36580 [Streptomyces sp. NPDC058525]|uniref:hypothetical protein n=1 Tax=Streptomyces sp. NPDC058525 TaxID=3346538 RepID=UPI003660E1B2